MNVSIIENKTEKVIGNYTINLHGLNYAPSKEEYFSQAWECAVEDGLVDENMRVEYRFVFNQ